MGQYGIALGSAAVCIRENRATLTCDTQHTLHICCWPRARKESDRSVQAGQDLGDDAGDVDSEEDG